MTHIRHPIPVNERFVRALHKIAFELICFSHGFEEVLHSKYDDLRRYIAFGLGSRSVGMEQIQAKTLEGGIPGQPILLTREHGLGWIVGIELVQRFHVYVGPGRVRDWKELVPIEPHREKTIVMLEFDVGPSLSAGQPADLEVVANS